MDSTHRELQFLLLWASQLSKRSSGGLGEVKKTVDGTPKGCFQRFIRCATVIAPLKLAGTYRNTQSGRHPSHSRSITLPPHQHLQKLPGPMTVNNGGDESFAIAKTMNSIGSIIMDKTYFRVGVRKIFSFMLGSSSCSKG